MSLPPPTLLSFFLSTTIVFRLASSMSTPAADDGLTTLRRLMAPRSPSPPPNVETIKEEEGTQADSGHAYIPSSNNISTLRRALSRRSPQPLHPHNNSINNSNNTHHASSSTFLSYGLQNYKSYACLIYGDSLPFQETPWGREWLGDIAVSSCAEDCDLLREEVSRLEREITTLALMLDEEKLGRREEEARLAGMEKEVERWRQDPTASVGSYKSNGVLSGGGGGFHSKKPEEKVKSIRGFLFGGATER